MSSSSTRPPLARRALALFLSLALVAALVPCAPAVASARTDGAGAGAALSAVAPASGMWGTCPWRIDASGVMTVEAGEGVSGEFPWRDDYADSVTEVRFVASGSKKVVFPEDSSNMFLDCVAVKQIDMTGSNTSYATNIRALFKGCVSLEDVKGLSGLDVSKVTNMGELFSDCESVTNLSFSGWNTSRVTDMSSAFYRCISLKALDVTSFDTSRVETLNATFQRCDSLVELNLSNFRTPRLKTMYATFFWCRALEILDLSSFDTSNVTTMKELFNWCISLKALNLSSFDTSKVNTTNRNFRSFFGACSSLASLSLSNKCKLGTDDNLAFPIRDFTVNGHADWWSTKDRKWYTAAQIMSGRSKVADTYTKDSSLLAGGAWGTCAWSLKSGGALSVGAGAGSGSSRPWLASASSITSAAFASGAVLPADASGLFAKCSAMKSVSLSGLGTSKVRDMSGMFQGCSKLASLDLSKFDTSAVEDMSAMFSGCSSLSSLDLSSFDTARVADMSQMFANCSRLSSLNVSRFKTPRLSGAALMFSGCSSLKSLNLSGLDTSGVTDFRWMFADCAALESLDVSGFDTSLAADMSRMFANCSSLASLDVSGFSTPLAEGLQGMFSGCSKLAALDLSGFDTSRAVSADRVSSFLDGCSALASLKLGKGCAFGSAASARWMPGTPVGGRADWWSAGEWRWMSAAEVMDSRSGVADTYSKVRGEPARVAVPVARTGLVWDGSVQVGVAPGTGYGLSGASSASAADVYACTASLSDKERTQWADGTTADKVLAWFIARAPIDAPDAAAGLVWNGAEQAGVPAGDGYVRSGTWAAAAAGDYTAVVAPDSNHRWRDGTTGLVELPWSIAKAALEGASVSEVGPYTYDGTAKEPHPSVTLNGRELSEGDDYDLSWEDNTAAGVARVTATGKGNCTGSVSAAFVIRDPAPPASVAIPTRSNGLVSDHVYDGAAHVGVLAGAGYVRAGAWEAAGAGEYACTVALADPARSQWADGTVADREVRWSVARAAIPVPAAASGLVYDGTEQEGVAPGDGYSLGGDCAAVDADSYTAVAAVDENHCWTGGGTGVKGIVWSIAAAPLAAAVLGGIPSYTHDGAAKEPHPSVTLNGRTLSEGVDYELSWKDNVGPGEARVTVTGKGNYTGTASAAFSIGRSGGFLSGVVTNSAVRLSAARLAWTGSRRAPSVTVVVGGAALAEGRDYSLSFSGACRDVGPYTVTVSGKGSYSGTATARFSVVPPAPRLRSVRAVRGSNGSGFRARWRAGALRPDGWQVRWSRSKSMTRAKSARVRASSKAGRRLSLAKRAPGSWRGKRAWVQVRAYKRAGGETLYSDWSAPKGVRVRR